MACVAFTLVDIMFEGTLLHVCLVVWGSNLSPCDSRHVLSNVHAARIFSRRISGGSMESMLTPPRRSCEHIITARNLSALRRRAHRWTRLIRTDRSTPLRKGVAAHESVQRNVKPDARSIPTCVTATVYVSLAQFFIKLSVRTRRRGSNPLSLDLPPLISGSTMIPPMHMYPI